VAFALTGAKADEREVLLALLTANPGLVTSRPGPILMGDRNYYGAIFKAALAAAEIRCCARLARTSRPGPEARFFRPLRQIIESVNDTFRGQLDLERHGGHTPEGVTVRVLQRILALTAAI
jgi:hypothetical protein